MNEENETSEKAQREIILTDMTVGMLLFAVCKGILQRAKILNVKT